MRYTADFSTPLMSTTGLNWVLTCGVGGVPMGFGCFTSGGLISPAWASTVMEVVVVGIPVIGVPCTACAALCARLATDPPRAAAYTLPSGIGTMERISGRLASYRTNALSFAVMR